MAKMTTAEIRLADTATGLRRVLTLLDELCQRAYSDDVTDLTVVDALGQAAKEEVKCLLSEIRQERPALAVVRRA
jgi:hypothetical protein